MKRFKSSLVILGIGTAMGLIVSCNDRSNSSDSSNNNDSDFTDTRRNTTDTVNYLTKDSGNKSQDVIDPEPPSNK